MKSQRYDKPAPGYVPTVMEVLMQRKGARQLHVAAAAGIYQSRISEMLSGRSMRNVSEDVQRKIAEYLGLHDYALLLRPFDPIEDAKGTYTGRALVKER